MRGKAIHITLYFVLFCIFLQSTPSFVNLLNELINDEQTVSLVVAQQNMPAVEDDTEENLNGGAKEDEREKSTKYVKFIPGFKWVLPLSKTSPTLPPLEAKIFTQFFETEVPPPKFSHLV
jgi:hypothetical protein